MHENLNIQSTGFLKGASAALLLFLAVSCIKEKRTDCPAPFTVTLEAASLADGSHGLTVKVEGGDEGFPLTATFKVDGSAPDGLSPDPSGKGYPMEPGGSLSVSLPRLPAGEHPVEVTVFDGDYTATDKAVLDVGNVDAKADFRTVSGGATVATVTYLSGDPVPYGVSFSLDGEPVEGGDRTVVIGTDRETVLTLPHREPGGHILAAAFSNGGFSQTLEFPFEAETPRLAVAASPLKDETVLDVLLEEGDLNTVYAMDVALDGKADVEARGKGFTYRKDKVAFPSSRRLSLSLPSVDDQPGRHTVKVTLKDGSFSVSEEVSFIVEEKIPFVPNLTLKRTGKDLWSVVVGTVSGEPEGTFSVSAKLDGNTVPGFLMADGKAVGNALRFASDKTLSFRMGAIPIGRHAFSLTLKGDDGTWPMTADADEDRLGISLSFKQKVYEDCLQGYFRMKDGVMVNRNDFTCIVHEEMTMSVDYGWKGAYAMEVYMKKASQDDPEAKVATRIDYIAPDASYSSARAREVPFEDSADLASGRTVVALPSGRPPKTGRDDDLNAVRVRLTPAWDGATTAEFAGTFDVPFDRMNGIWLSTKSDTAEAGVDTWSSTTNSGFGYQYLVNGLTVKSIKSDGIETDWGIMYMPWYKTHPPQVTVRDPDIAEARAESTYNLINVRGLKEGKTEVTIAKDLGTATIPVTVTKTRAGDGFEVTFGDWR